MEKTIIVKQINVQTGEEVEVEEVIEINEEEIARNELQAKINEAKEYLASTDWYVTRFTETGKEIPEEVKIKREEARTII